MKENNGTVLVLILASALHVISCGPVYAQGDSVCVDFSGSSEGLVLELRSEISVGGTLPLRLCGLPAGRSYTIELRGTGFEKRRGKLYLDEAGRPAIHGNRLSNFARNIVPGWGSIHEGRSGDGWTDIASISAAGLLTLKEDREYRHLENRLAVLNGRLDAAVTVEERKIIRTAANEASRDINVQNMHRKRCLVYTAYLYGFQLIDPWLVGNPPGSSAGSGVSGIELKGSRSSPLKAAFLSALRPGRGQFYQGKIFRGTFFSLATAAGALAALDYLNLYDEAVDAYELNLEYYDRAETADEKRYYRERSYEYWDDVEKTRGWRNISLGVLAGLWAAGTIDAFFPGDDGEPLEGLTYDIGPSSAFLVYRF